MSANGTGQQVYRIAEIRTALNCANSTIYRMIDRGEIAVVDTPLGRRVTAAEFERLRGGKPLHAVHEPDPKRQAMAAHARKAKAEAKTQTANTAVPDDQLNTFMQTVIERLDRIEAAVTQGAEDQAVGPVKTPLGSRMRRSPVREKAG